MSQADLERTFDLVKTVGGREGKQIASSAKPAYSAEWELLLIPRQTKKRNMEASTSRSDHICPTPSTFLHPTSPSYSYQLDSPPPSYELLAENAPVNLDTATCKARSLKPSSMPSLEDLKSTNFLRRTREELVEEALAYLGSSSWNEERHCVTNNSKSMYSFSFALKAVIKPAFELLDYRKRTTKIHPFKCSRNDHLRLLFPSLKIILRRHPHRIRTK